MEKNFHAAETAARQNSSKRRVTTSYRGSFLTEDKYVASGAFSNFLSQDFSNFISETILPNVFDSREFFLGLKRVRENKKKKNIARRKVL